MYKINITGMDKAEVLRQLFNCSKVQGMGVMQNHRPEMSIDEARELLRGGDYFDYVRGRVMKIKLSGEYLIPTLYDRDNGEWAAAEALGISDERIMAHIQQY